MLSPLELAASLDAGDGAVGERRDSLRLTREREATALDVRSVGHVLEHLVDLVGGAADRVDVAVARVLGAEGPREELRADEDDAQRVAKIVGERRHELGARPFDALEPLGQRLALALELSASRRPRGASSSPRWKP